MRVGCSDQMHSIGFGQGALFSWRDLPFLASELGLTRVGEN